MRPYIAVIADSFRAAFASRVLWVALATIYLFLIAASPIGYKEVFTTSFRWTDFSNGTRLKAMLARAINETNSPQSETSSEKSRETPAGRVARHLPSELQDNLRKVAEGQEVRIRLDIFADGLNSLYLNDQWYDPLVWTKTPRLKEQRDIEGLPEAELTEELRQRLARLRIEAALPGVFENRAARSIALTYAGFQFPAVFQFEKSQFKLILNLFVLRLIVDWLLGFVMIFLGILATASIIPDMLQPGSLHLLLSKPVSRPILFLAKFVGGCAFVLVCVSQLIFGIWLIAGIRLDIWNPRLLLCIPACVFLFSVFFSVSAVAGLKWRSPILSIGLANLFGAVCLITGLGASLSDNFVVDRDRITGLTLADQTVLASTRGGHLRRFNPLTKRWADLFPDDTGRNDRVMPPLTLPDSRVISARVRGGRMNVFGSGATPLLVIEDPKAGLPQPSLDMPTGTRELILGPNGELLALGSGELLIGTARSILADDPTPDRSKTDTKANPVDQTAIDSIGSWLPKLTKMMGGATEGFRSVLPPGLALQSPNSATFSPSGASLFVYSAGLLIRLDRQGEIGSENWIVAARAEIEPKGKTAWLRGLGNCLVLLRDKTEPRFLDRNLHFLDPPPSIAAKIESSTVRSAVSCEASILTVSTESDGLSEMGEGAIAIQSDDGLVQMLTLSEGGLLALEQLREVTQAEAINWDKKTSRLLIAHGVDQVSAWKPITQDSNTEAEANWERAETPSIKPLLQGWRLLDRYLVFPLRSLVPQTGELGETISALVSGENTLRLPFTPAEEDSVIVRYNIWRPVLTCGGFVVSMLILGCVYFSRSDF
jgi:hypothetical protein